MTKTPLAVPTSGTRALPVFRLKRPVERMSYLETRSEPSRVELPADALPPFEVFLNGVPQQEGKDFRVEGRWLVFERTLAHEGKLGFWRWLSLLLGVAGTYRQNDSVDVVYARGGRRVVANNLPITR
jgi:hypothetical protein